jgi:hypothetical protein
MYDFALLFNSSNSKFYSSIYSHELNDLSFKTILFFRRPDRVISTQNILDFIGNRTAVHDGSYVNISFSA